MKKTGYVAGILFSVVTASFVGQAVGAPGEPSQLEQAEELATTSEDSRCPLQQTVFQMIGIFVDNISLDYQGQALRIRILGSDDGLSIMGFDRRVPYLELGRFELQDDSFCTGDLIDRGFDLAGTEESEIVLGTNATDRIRGRQGNDTLDGAEGDDIYFFDDGDGVDCIHDSSGRTTISFGDGILPKDVMIAKGARAQERTLFLRIAPKRGSRASQGLNVRTDSRAQLSSPDFRFVDGSTFTLRELQRVAKSRGLNSRSLARERLCHFDAQSAAHAGLPNKRAFSPQLPPMPVLKVVPPHNPATMFVIGSDGRLREITQQKCTVSPAGERTCR